jgi:hypothetical protein
MEFCLFSLISKVLVIISKDIFFTFDEYFRSKYFSPFSQSFSAEVANDLFEKSFFIFESLKKHFHNKIILTGDSLKLNFKSDTSWTRNPILEQVLPVPPPDFLHEQHIISQQIDSNKFTDQEFFLFLETMLHSQTLSTSSPNHPPEELNLDFLSILGEMVTQKGSLRTGQMHLFRDSCFVCVDSNGQLGFEEKGSEGRPVRQNKFLERLSEGVDGESSE